MLYTIYIIHLYFIHYGVIKRDISRYTGMMASTTRLVRTHNIIFKDEQAKW